MLKTMKVLFFKEYRNNRLIISSDKSSTYNVLMEQNVPSGIILFEDMISNGAIEVTVTFEELGKDDLAQIVFN